MRYLAARNPKHSRPITLVRMRDKFDCMTCATAMLLGIKYKEVEQAFGGNVDPAKGKEEQSSRVYSGFVRLLTKYHHNIIESPGTTTIVEGRRYWVVVGIDDPSNPLSKIMDHSIVVDEFGKVFDPNPQYGEFKSMKEWRDAMTLPHELKYVREIFEYTL